MGMNQTPAAERVHIGFFGRRNAGKSSIINSVTGQDLSVVSDQKGTTTDPVYKSMELLPLGPVVLIDTPGIDDTGELGALRVRKSRQVLNKTDAAVLVIDGTEGIVQEELDLIRQMEKKGIPFLAVCNKEDQAGPEEREELRSRLVAAGVEEGRILWISAREKTGITALKEQLSQLTVGEENGRRLVGDLIAPSDLVVLVTPIDKAAPKGRLILPQQQTIRDILDAGAAAVAVQDRELEGILDSLARPPRMVITDSQVFRQTAAVTPREIPLTSFSILFARYKGNLASAVEGVTALDRLQEGDSILISEGCTHHRQCGDIGTEKIPRWIREYTGKELNFQFTSGTEFPEDLRAYQLILHCGGCMLNEREMKYRLGCARDQHVPMTNYGILIAYIQGILKRSVEVFPDIARLLAQ